jgi:hypothetical protein
MKGKATYSKMAYKPTTALAIAKKFPEEIRQTFFVTSPET